MSAGSGGGGGGDVFAAIVMAIIFAVMICVFYALAEIAIIHARLWDMAKEYLIVSDVAAALGFLVATAIGKTAGMEPYALYMAALTFSAYSVTMLALDARLAALLEEDSGEDPGDLDTYLEFAG